MYKIAIIGPESTGKSELAHKLAEIYNEPWVPEYAREYVEKLKRPYTYRDICKIARRQIEEENFFDTEVQKPKIVFFDTDLIVTKVWFEYCYKRIPFFLKQRIKHNNFDLYLLCEPDLPWEPDPVREHSDDRQFFFFWYRKEIELLKKPYVIINGQGENRTINAIKAIESKLKS